MKVPEAELTNLYRKGTSRAASGRETCLSAEELTRMAQGELPSAERRRAAAHLAECSDCSLELRMISTLAPWSEELSVRLDGISEAADSAGAGPGSARVTDLEAVRRKRVPRFRRWLPAALAAALALMAVGLYLIQPSRPAELPQGDVVRGIGHEVEPAAGAALSRIPGRFSWPAQLGASSYRVRIFDAQADLVWESEPLDGTEITVPPAITERMRTAGSLSWTVELEGSVERSRLGPFSFHVTHE